MKKKLKFIGGVVIIVYLGYVFVSTQLTINRLETDAEVKYNQLQQLKEKNAQLKDEVNNLKISSEGYLEKLARERLGLIKPGETPVIDTSGKSK